MKKIKHYVYTKKKQPFFKIIQFILKIGYRKPKVFINYNDFVPTDGLLIGPHMAKPGPYYISQYYPAKCAIVGASPMLGSYKERFHYLRDIYYMKKNHKGKFSSSLKAGFEAIFSIYFYKGMHLIPSYEDIRLIQTIDNISQTIENGLPVFIFPEDSDKGYQLVLNKIRNGYITIAKFAGKKLNREIPIYPYYVNKKRREFVIGKPCYLSQLKGKTNDEINEFMMDKINKLNPHLEEDKKLNCYYHEIY